MAEPLTRQSPLRDVYTSGHYGATGPGTPGITLKARTGLTILDLQVWQATRAKVQAALDDRLIEAIWFGPDRWLLVGDEVEFDFDSNDGLLTDISHGMSAIRLSGKRLRDLLSKGTNIDLRPASFLAGSVAMTQLDHIHVTLHMVRDDCVDIYFRRSYGVSLFEWLMSGAREYGCRVEESEGL
jgi:heterotetrameric sarcosine oxidase gamma subunit